MDMSGFQHRISTLSHLVPTQKDVLERLHFQLTFNNFRHIHLVAGHGGGKSTVAMALAELFSDTMNIAFVRQPLAKDQLIPQLSQQWLGVTSESEAQLRQQLLSLATDVADRLVLIVDDFAQYDAEVQQLILTSPCLLLTLSDKQQQEAGVNLFISSMTLADAEQVLGDTESNPLLIAERFAQADGNYYQLATNTVLSDMPVIIPQQEQPVARTAETTRWTFPLIPVAITLLLIIVAAFWFWPEQKDVSDNERIEVQHRPWALPDRSSPNLTDTKIPEPDAATTEPVTEPESIAGVPAEPEPAQVVEQRLPLLSEADSAVEAVPEPVQQAVVPETDRQPVKTQPVYHYQEAALLAMAEQQFVVQLAVLSGDAAVRRFLTTYPDLTIQAYQRNLNGKKQVVLLLAPFASRADARNAVAVLPQALRSDTPFIRAVKAVQQDITAFQQSNR